MTLGAPRKLPTGWALYYGDHHCEGVYDAFRVADTRDGDTLGVERPWTFFDEQPGYTYSFSVSRGGQTLAVLACERGVCESGHSSPSEDALLALWVSRDDGLVWERQGDAPQGAWISAVAEDDVALQVRTSDQDERPEFRAWWFHAEHEVAASSGIHPAIVIGWYEDAGELRPIWRRLSQPGYAVDSGRPLTSPLADRSGGADVEWRLTTVLPDDSLLWSWIEWGKGRGQGDLFTIADQEGSVRSAYSWSDAGQHLELADYLGADTFVGSLGPNICGEPRETVLVDLATRSVHPIAGSLSDIRQQNSPFGGGILLGTHPVPSE